MKTGAKLLGRGTEETRGAIFTQITLCTPWQSELSRARTYGGSVVCPLVEVGIGSIGSRAQGPGRNSEIAGGRSFLYSRDEVHENAAENLNHWRFLLSGRAYCSCGCFPISI